MDICLENKWKFALTFKEGVMPKVWEDVCSAQHMVDSSSFHEIPDENGKMCAVGLVAWVLNSREA